MNGNGMPQIGDVIAEKYRLEKVAGEGGMGVVYVAEHLVLKQRVAVKVLLADAVSSESTVERFAREARAAAKINSEHVARVLDAGSTASGAPFLVMEFLEGCDLEELLELQRTLPVMEAVDYAIQTLEGLAHAHAANIVHRDLKPANLFLGVLPDGRNAIKVLDFGISKSTEGKPEDKKLTGQHVLGSPVYMSPEQLRNATNIDARADIWSIGIVLYEMLAGDPPFDGQGVGEIFAAILEKEPVPLSDKNPRIPHELSEIVMKCLRRQPDERWRDAGELARALAPFGSESALPIVERTEQVLARSQQLRGLHTSPEAQRVVAAIDAASARAMATTRGRSSDAILLLKKPKDGVLTRSEGRPARLLQAVQRRPLAVAALVVAVLGLGAVGAVRAMRGTPSTTLALTPPEPSAHASSEAKTNGDTVTSAQPEPPVMMDLPPNPVDRPPASGSKPKSGKPQRPKFLNSRE